jgi:hypothetical protein
MLQPSWTDERNAIALGLPLDFTIIPQHSTLYHKHDFVFVELNCC